MSENQADYYKYFYIFLAIWLVFLACYGLFIRFVWMTDTTGRWSFENDKSGYAGTGWMLDCNFNLNC